MSLRSLTGFREKFCRMDVKNRNSSIRASPSPAQMRFPAENGMKQSLLLKVPFAFRKCPGSNFSGFGNSLQSCRMGDSKGNIMVSLGIKQSLSLVSLITACGTLRGRKSMNLWISWMTASVYGNWLLSAMQGLRSRPTTRSISLCIFSSISGCFRRIRSPYLSVVLVVPVPARNKSSVVLVKDSTVK